MNPSDSAASTTAPIIAGYRVPALQDLFLLFYNRFYSLAQLVRAFHPRRPSEQATRLWSRVSSPSVPPGTCRYFHREHSLFSLPLFNFLLLPMSIEYIYTFVYEPGIVASSVVLFSERGVFDSNSNTTAPEYIVFPEMSVYFFFFYVLRISSVFPFFLVRNVKMSFLWGFFLVRGILALRYPGGHCNGAQVLYERVCCPRKGNGTSRIFIISSSPPPPPACFASWVSF